MTEENFPIGKQDVIHIFNGIRSEVMARFMDLLKLAYTREERDTIVLKMEQLEQEIQKRVRPFEVKNKVVSLKTLKDIDTIAFKRIAKEIAQDKETLAKYTDLGKDFLQYIDEI